MTMRPLNRINQDRHQYHRTLGDDFLIYQNPEIERMHTKKSVWYVEAGDAFFQSSSFLVSIRSIFGV